MWKCPNCNNKNEDFADIIDNDYYNEFYVDKAIGECSKCSKRYFINIFYKYSHYEAEEMED